METSTADNRSRPRDPSADAPGEVELSIVMPCLNEEETLAACIGKARRFLETHGVRGEVVVADNGSTDASPEIARRMGARLVRVERRGYGAALMAGIEAARGEYVIMGDADDSYDFEHLELFLERLRAGDDLVMGNRFRGGIAAGAMPPLHRYLGNPVLTGLGRLFFDTPARDFHCGLRGFRRRAAAQMDLQMTGMEFASEMVVKASLLGLKTSEVPTTLSVDGRSRPPHLRSWRDGWRHLRFLLLFSPRWLFLVPGLLLIAAGLGLGGWLLPGPRQVAGTTLDINTLLYAAVAVLVGAQSVLFAILTKIFAINAGLLPRDRRLRWLGRERVLEAGLVCGLALVVLGVAGSVFAVQAWSEQSFGVLDPSRIQRLVIPSALAIGLGFEVMLSSFFISVLALARKDSAAS